MSEEIGFKRSEISTARQIQIFESYFEDMLTSIYMGEVSGHKCANILSHYLLNAVNGKGDEVLSEINEHAEDTKEHGFAHAH